MDAPFAAPLLLVILAIVVSFAATLGVDSRDGFADDQFRQGYR